MPYLWIAKAYGTRMEYDDPHHRHMQGRQRSKIKVITSCCYFEAFAHNLTKESCRSTKIGQKVVRAMGDIAHQCQGPKVKVTRQINDHGGSSSRHLLGAGAYCGDLPHSLLRCVLALWTTAFSSSCL